MAHGNERVNGSITTIYGHRKISNILSNLFLLMWIYGSFFSSSTLLMRLLLFVIMFCCDCECVCVCVYVCICVCVQANTTLQPSKLIVLSLSDNIKATTKCRKLIYIQQQKHLCSPKYMWHLYFENKIMHNRVVNVVKVNIKVRKHSHFNFTLYARISPQWLSKLRWLWPNVPWQVGCQLVSG